ncbi:hypothetical protein [Leptolyngbya sp. Heron Island J]|uniref:hypothetical protein n=1 Tax=Leptolyngbya sp. Heron Island J TaxID=1385935 RepID=UPI001268FF55|nr:hypothetical protein [Leptolyngbya sp. Heron Island J]
MSISSTRVSKALITRLPVLAGITVMVAACGGNAASDDSSSPATPVSLRQSDMLVLEVQPIQVCDDTGFICAQVEFFEAITDKIWSQANIDVEFLPLNQLNDSTYLTTDEDEFLDLSFSGNPGDFGRHPDSTEDSGPINLWFVDVIETTTGLIQYGNAWIGLNGILISDDILDFNNGLGRIDVIAHELGHNLGLRHSTFGAGPAENLMSSGLDRTVPESIDDIFPDGDGLSTLTSEQIEVARTSRFLTDAEADESLPAIAAADAIPQEAPPILLASTSPTPIAVPDASPSLLTWLLVLPLGQKVYSRINR